MRVRVDKRRDLPPGTRIKQKYEVLAHLGSGAFGSVYRVRHLIVGRERALKILHPHLAQDDRTRGRFIREARVLLDLGSHPNLVVTHDVDLWEASGAPPSIYIDMDFHPGENLSEVLRARRRLPAAEAVPIIVQVLRALQHAHEHGVVHRDVKPLNVLVVAGGRGPVVKVLDFGVAGFLGPGASKGAADETAYPHGPVGTWPYMSPEQVVAGPGVPRADARADLYGVGVVLFEMLAGRLPFPGRTMAELRRQIVHDPPPTFAQAGIPEEWAGLESLVHRALAKDRKARPRSAREMADELDGIARAHRPIRRRPDGPAGKGRSTARQRRGSRQPRSGVVLDRARVLQLFREWQFEDLGREIDQFLGGASPEHFRTTVQLARVCIDCGLLGEAERVLTRAMTLAGTEADHHEVHGLLAEAYLERQTTDAAAREIARLPAASALALHLRGRLALVRGEARAAWSFFRRAAARTVATSPLGQQNRLFLAIMLFRIQRQSEACTILERLRAERNATPQVQGECLRFLAINLGLQNEFHRALDLFRQALKLLNEEGLHFHRARVLRSYGMTLLSEGEHAYARDRLQEALTCFERLGKTREAAITCSKIGHTHLVVGDTREAIAWYQKDHQTSLLDGLSESLAHVQLNLGRAYRMNGDLDAARGYLRDAVAAFERFDPGYALGLALYESAYCAIKQGDLGAGSAFLEGCRREFRRGGRTGREGWIKLLEALLLWRRGRRHEVQTADAFDQAIHLLRTADRDLRLAEAYLDYGQFLDERGDHSAASDKLSAAMEEASLRGLEGVYRSAHARLQRIDPMLTARNMLKSFQARDLLDAANESLLGKREAPRRVDAAVLFADIRGFTPLVTTLDVVRLGDLVDRFWRRMDLAVKRSGGVLDKFIGDCVMAVFPCEAQDDDYCRRAVQAARQMVEEVQIGNHAQPDYQIALGVGIHEGPILWGVFGSAHRMAHTAMGDVVNVAARIQGLAPENTILVSEEVHQRVDGKFRWKLHARRQALKGKTTPVELWRVESEEVT